MYDFQNPNDLNKNFSNRWAIFARRTTFHGFREFREAKKWWEMVFWVIVILGCSCMLIWHIQKQTSKLFSGERATRVTRLQTERYDFPPIWVGLTNWLYIDSTILRQYNLTYEEMQIAKSYMTYGTQYNSSVPVEEAKQRLQYTIKRLNLSGLSELFQFVSSASLFRLNGLNDKSLISEQRIAESASYYLINSSKAAKSFFGRSWVFAFEFDFPLYRKLVFENAMFFRMNPNDTLTQMSFTPPILMNMDADQMVQLQPGRGYQISANCLIYKQLEKCINKPRGIDGLDLINVCKLECYLKNNITFNASNCVKTGGAEDLLPITQTFMSGRATICSQGVNVNGNQELEGKDVPVFRKFSTKESRLWEEKVKECLGQCQPNCEQWTTAWSVVSTEYLSLNPDMDTASVQIAFPDAETLVIIEEVEAYQWHDLLSDLGGLLGLWLGASMMSLFQIVHLCFWADQLPKERMMAPRNVRIKTVSVDARV